MDRYQQKWKAADGYAIDMYNGRLIRDNKTSATQHFYKAYPGDALIPVSAGFEFFVAVYDQQIDDKYIYTYDYEPEESWTVYNGNIGTDGFISHSYTFSKEVWFRICIRREAGIQPLQLEDIIQFKPISLHEQSPLLFFDEIEKSIEEYQNVCAQDSVTFLLLTDSHYVVNGTWEDTFANMKKVAEQVDLDGVIHLGDLTDGLVSGEVTSDYVKMVRKEFKSLGIPVYQVLGNHDYNYFRGNPECFSEEKMKELYLDNSRQPYYYQDIEEKRIRLVVLNSFNPKENCRYGFDEKQLDWLEQLLMNTKQDWYVLVLSHVPPTGRLHYWSSEIRGSERLMQILRRFSNRSNANLLGFLHGHNHADQIDNIEQFPIISIGSAKCEYYKDKKPEGATVYTRKLGDVSQELWDIFTISRKNHSMDFIRFGAGENRHLEITQCVHDAKKGVPMKKVITYGTFDLFHEGHYRLLKRAKELGDYLIVGVTTEYYDEQRGKINVVDSLLERIENVKKSGLADKIIIEDHEGQKIEDIQKYEADIFTIGSDWVGVFDYLKAFCQVVYLERTPYISSSLLRSDRYPIRRIGVVGTGRIAPRFMSEAKFVSGINVQCAYNPNKEHALQFENEQDIKCYYDSFGAFLETIDAIYIASPHETHYSYARQAIEAGKHVLCEKPLAFTEAEAVELYQLAKENQVVLMEAVKTAYCPGFAQMINVAKSGKIGDIVDVEACFSRITNPQMREMVDTEYGGAFLEFGSYTLLPIIKLLGTDYESVSFDSIYAENGIDLYTKIHFRYPNALATSKTGIGAKSEGQLIIAGTKGYILAQSPWWLTRKFEIRYEDPTKIDNYTPKFLGDGLRYEIAEFLSKMNGCAAKEFKLTKGESIAMAKVVEQFLTERRKKKEALRQSNKDSGIRIWAHRGCSYAYPENTLQAFQAAAKLPGITGIELDVQRTKDGELVVFHDETVDRLMNASGQIQDYTMEELRGMNYKTSDPEPVKEKIPSLKEVLNLLKPYCQANNMMINIELKNSVIPYDGMEEQVLSLVREYEMNEYIIYSSFSAPSIEKVKTLDPRCKTGVLCYKEEQCKQLAETVHADAIHPNVDTVEADITIPGGMPVRAWNSKEPFFQQSKYQFVFELSKLKKKGITDIFTNMPEEYL